MQLVQTLSDALARTKDAQQFQIQTEVALLTACDLDTSAVLSPPAAVPARTIAAPTSLAFAAPRTLTDGETTAPKDAEAVAAEHAPAVAPPVEPEAVAPSPPAAPANNGALAAKWADVVDAVKERNPLLASNLSSAQPIAIEDSVITVAFSTEFNRKGAEKSTNRMVIETALKRVYGTELRLKAVANGESASLLDDPVINFAQRTFGGQPKRL
jgi:DNA polymerase-3 subunit gamma/tau